MKSVRIPTLFLTLLVLSVLTGCAGRSPDSNFYVLRSPAQQNLSVSSSTTIGVGMMPVLIPGYLDRSQIVSRSGDGVNVRLAEYERWGESLSDAITRVLADTMSVTLGEQFQVFPWLAESPADVRISVEIKRFDGSLNQNVYIDAWWSLRDRDTVLCQGRFADSLPAGSSYTSMVEAQSTLAVRLGEALATALQKSVPAR